MLPAYAACGISIHTLLAESDQGKRGTAKSARYISIHTLLAESDPCLVRHGVGVTISIHTLLAESDVLGAVTSPEVSRFLSTLSLRRATGPLSLDPVDIRNFYPHSPCGERRPPGTDDDRARKISIHTLLAESDDCVLRFGLFGSADFYPHSPCGERRQ